MIYLTFMQLEFSVYIFSVLITINMFRVHARANSTLVVIFLGEECWSTLNGFPIYVLPWNRWRETVL